MSSLTAVRPPAKSDASILDAMPDSWRAWAAKYLRTYRQAARDLPRQGEEFHRLVARMAAGPMPAYPLPQPPAFRSIGKLAEEDPEAFDRLNDAWADYPPAAPMTEEDMDAMARYYGQD